MADNDFDNFDNGAGNGVGAEDIDVDVVATYLITGSYYVYDQETEQAIQEVKSILEMNVNQSLEETAQALMEQFYGCDDPDIYQETLSGLQYTGWIYTTLPSGQVTVTVPHHGTFPDEESAMNFYISEYAAPAVSAPAPAL